MTIVEEQAQVPLPPSKPTLPSLEPVSLRPFHWKVTRDGLFSLSAQDYEVLSNNMAELLRWVKAAAARLRYYETGDLEDVSR